MNSASQIAERQQHDGRHRKSGMQSQDESRQWLPDRPEHEQQQAAQCGEHKQHGCGIDQQVMRRVYNVNHEQYDGGNRGETVQQSDRQRQFASTPFQHSKERAAESHQYKEADQNQ